MRIERDITFAMKEGFECVMRVVTDVVIRPEDYDYKIESMEMIEFHGHPVSVELDELDCRGEINRQIRDSLDDYISTHCDELLYDA